MKKKELLKKLKDKEACFVEQGGNHEIWKSKNGHRFPVPRHTEIRESTAKKILKQADR